ncbi:PRC-barrel domain containing protein [Saccharothrix syringae]|uniref:PRC-barrel domain containing protein n=2 Tax=Saccharothrix syringae TaxID=103733 RepID=A0A5Q0HF93_SACSY|nr:PRC-barrel domain containing protein [Saccharothrix syringae]
MQPHPFPFAPWMWRDAVALFDNRNEAVVDHDRPDVGLVGYEVEAVDGRIGKVDDANARVPADCLLVDTGTWLTSHQVVLPVGAVAGIDHGERRVHVDRTREQVKNAPEYDADFDADEFRARLGEYYTESYRTAP